MHKYTYVKNIRFLMYLSTSLSTTSRDLSFVKVVDVDVVETEAEEAWVGGEVNEAVERKIIDDAKKIVIARRRKCFAVWNLMKTFEMPFPKRGFPASPTTAVFLHLLQILLTFLIKLLFLKEIGCVGERDMCSEVDEAVLNDGTVLYDLCAKECREKGPFLVTEGGET